MVVTMAHTHSPESVLTEEMREICKSFEAVYTKVCPNNSDQLTEACESILQTSLTDEQRLKIVSYLRACAACSQIEEYAVLMQKTALTLER